MKSWNLLPPPPQSFLDEHPELPEVVAHLLYHRNIVTQEAIDEFLYPEYSKHIHDPFLFRDMEKAVDRLFLAIKKEETITIHGDYDADGVSASVILTNVLRTLGATKLNAFLPHRETDGYGLNKNTVQLLADQGTKVIITCDCGISNTEEVFLATEKGLDVIITDHHTIPPVLPPAFATIHPKIEGETYPDKGLAGGGVAFKLMQGLLKKHKETHELLPNGQTHEALEKWSLDMAAIASVADMVPLIGESRTLTKYGLLVLNKTRRIGLQKMLLEARLMDETGAMKRELDAYTIGFHIAPRINAAGRMEHANVAYNLLITEDPIEATDLAFQLNNNNEDRQKLTEQFVNEAIVQVNANQKDAPFLFIFGKDWTTGIVGLIASRIKELYHKPTIAMAMNNGNMVGSGRSIEGFNMIGAMQEMPQFFQKFGGHPMACGFTLQSPDIVDQWKEQLTTAFLEKTRDLNLSAAVNIDAEISLEDVTWELYDLLDKFKPFGQANPEPHYVAKGVTIVDATCLGKDGKHLKLLLSHKTPRIRKAVGWGMWEKCKDLSPDDKLDIVFEVSVNEWNGNRELQLTIVDFIKV